MERATRAICTVDSTASLRTVSKTVHNDAVDSTVRGRNALQIARVARSMRTPKIAFAWSARRVRFVSRCNGRRSFRPHHYARFRQPCTMT
eukprot:3399374-Lingulodinium_polyedra.AAC.1